MAERAAVKVIITPWLVQRKEHLKQHSKILKSSKESEAEV